MSIAAKSENVELINTLNNQCCRNAIQCPPGSYCLAGAAHGSLFSLKKADSTASTGGKDFEAPQMGIAGNYYAAGTDNPLGTGKYSKRRRSNVAVIIVNVIFIGAFLVYCLLLNHSFQTNPNRIANCFKLFSLLQLYNYIAPALLFDF